jgi:two-component system, OmpR family, sensor kinase
VVDDPPKPCVSSDAASEIARLRQLVDEQRLAIRARDDFIAIAAHELRNPMTPILGIAQLAYAAALQGGSTCPPRVKALLEQMQVAVEEFIKRATKLLDVSRIESGNLRLEPSETHLSVVAASVAQKYAVAAARGQSPLEIDLESGIVGFLDTLALEQVIDNLMSNALKFGIGKAVTLRLRSEGRLAKLEVQDRGVGMDQDQQSRIFGRFEQVVTQHSGSGFGVGLWVANRLVAAMNGRISVSSQLGQGSTFTVTLPLEASEPEQSAT